MPIFSNVWNLVMLAHCGKNSSLVIQWFLIFLSIFENGKEHKDNVSCRPECRQLQCKIETLSCWIHTNARLDCNLGHLEENHLKGYVLFFELVEGIHSRCRQSTFPSCILWAEAWSLASESSNIRGFQDSWRLKWLRGCPTSSTQSLLSRCWDFTDIFQSKWIDKGWLFRCSWESKQNLQQRSSGLLSLFEWEWLISNICQSLVTCVSLMWKLHTEKKWNRVVY